MVIQKTTYSSDKLYKEYNSILNAVGEFSIAKAFEQTSNPFKFKEIFKSFLKTDFLDMDSFVEGYEFSKRVPYTNLSRVMFDITKFSKNSTWADDSKKYIKLNGLLDGLYGTDAKVVLRVMTRDYDTKAMSTVLFPQPKKEPVKQKSKDFQKIEIKNPSVVENSKEIKELDIKLDVKSEDVTL